MKINYLLALSALLLSSAVQAEEISVKVPAGLSYVRLETSFTSSGCSGTETYFPVVRSEVTGAYIASGNVAVVNLQEYLKKMSDLSRQPPRMTCMAIVTHSQIAAFVHSALRAETIKVEIPAGEAGVKVKVTPVSFQ
jgi:hypothetical protein